jgi:hypothetical protein
MYFPAAEYSEEFMLFTAREKKENGRDSPIHGFKAFTTAVLSELFSRCQTPWTFRHKTGKKIFYKDTKTSLKRFF